MVLRDVYGLPHEAIAEELGISLSAAKVRLHRAPASGCGTRCSRRRGRLVRYEDVADLIPGLVDGTVEVDDRTRAFIESDLRCQAELARYRRLLRGLGTLRTTYLEPAPGGLAQTLNTLAAEGERRVARSILTGRRMVVAGAALGGAAVAGCRDRGGDRRPLASAPAGRLTGPRGPVAAGIPA